VSVRGEGCECECESECEVQRYGVRRYGVRSVEVLVRRCRGTRCGGAVGIEVAVVI
jgi:hypothetical protein